MTMTEIFKPFFVILVITEEPRDTGQRAASWPPLAYSDAFCPVPYEVTL